MLVLPTLFQSPVMSVQLGFSTVTSVLQILEWNQLDVETQTLNDARQPIMSGA
jgi:hypothetical protein